MQTVNFNMITEASPEQLRKIILQAGKIYTDDLKTDQSKVIEIYTELGWMVTPAAKELDQEKIYISKDNQVLIYVQQELIKSIIIPFDPTLHIHLESEYSTEEWKDKIENNLIFDDYGTEFMVSKMYHYDNRLYVNMELNDVDGGSVYQMGYIDLTTFEYHIIFPRFHEEYLEMYQDLFLLSERNSTTQIWDLSGEQHVMLYELPGRLMIDGHYCHSREDLQYTVYDLLSDNIYQFNIPDIPNLSESIYRSDMPVMPFILNNKIYISDSIEIQVFQLPAMTHIKTLNIPGYDNIIVEVNGKICITSINPERDSNTLMIFDADLTLADSYILDVMSIKAVNNKLVMLTQTPFDKSVVIYDLDTKVTTMICEDEYSDICV